MKKRMIFIFNVLLVASLAACSQITIPTSNLPVLPTFPPTNLPAILAPTLTLPADSVKTVLPATLAQITAQNAGSLRLSQQIVLADPANQYLWSKDGSLVIATNKGYAHFTAPSFKQDGFTDNSFADQIMAVSPDGSNVVSLQKDGSLLVWDLVAIHLKQTIQPAETPMQAVFSPDSKMLAVTSADTISVSLWDVTTGKQIATLKGFDTVAPVYQVQFSPDGRTLVWIARATVQFMDIASEILGARLTLEDFVNSLVFAPDGKTVALAVADFVTLRRISDGSEIQQFPLGAPVSGLAFSPDGQMLAFAKGNEIDIERVTSGQRIALLNVGAVLMTSVGFSLDGYTLMAGTDDGEVFFWQVLS